MCPEAMASSGALTLGDQSVSAEWKPCSTVSRGNFPVPKGMQVVLHLGRHKEECSLADYHGQACPRKAEN